MLDLINISHTFVLKTDLFLKVFLQFTVRYEIINLLKDEERFEKKCVGVSELQVKTHKNCLLFRVFNFEWRKYNYLTTTTTVTAVR